MSQKYNNQSFKYSIIVSAILGLSTSIVSSAEEVIENDKDQIEVIGY
jgi:hypothetical protein